MRKLAYLLAATVVALFSSGCSSEDCVKGSTKCGNVCVQLGSDNLNCGACGNACGGGLVCSGGGCAVTCQAGLTNCSGSCVDTAIDDANCGTCANVCGALTACTGSTCVSTETTFDSLTGTQSITSRAAGNGCGSQVTVGANHLAVTSIASNNAIGAAGQIKYLIYSHPGHVLLYSSAPQAVTAGTQSWKISPTMFLPLTAGSQYDFGAITDVAVTYYYDAVAETTTDFVTTVTNPNFATFATPTVSGHAGADCGVQINYHLLH
jgi:hypothetical protein